MQGPVASDHEGGTGQSHRCIVFLHIPKTGGRTLRATLRFRYPSETLLFYAVSQPLERIEKFSLEDRRAARVVTGHFPYGVHRHIPQECEYITVLRDPISRVISQYYTILGNPDHSSHDRLVRSGMGLEEWARTAEDRVHNLQTRLISGRRPGEVALRGPDGRAEPAELGPEAVEEAKGNLDRFLVVGLTERFDESFILIRRALGWRLPMYATRNVTRRPSRPEPPPRAAVEVIRERNRLDLELYDHARELFSGTVDRQGSSFRREVAAFKILNRIPNRIGPLIPAELRRPLGSILSR